MKRSTERILTTHTGSLPRPPDLLEMIRNRQTGQPVEPQAFADRVKSAVGEVVRKQVEVGVDVVSDGELGKPAFNTYVARRLAGFGVRTRNLAPGRRQRTSPGGPARLGRAPPSPP